MDTPVIFKTIPLFGPVAWLVAGGEDNDYSTSVKDS